MNETEREGDGEGEGERERDRERERERDRETERVDCFDGLTKFFDIIGYHYSLKRFVSLIYLWTASTTAVF